jgi:hypothetical protein
MAAKPVEWVLVIFYGASAHRATYGRLAGDANNNRYTKDYIQLSQRADFLEVLTSLFPATARGSKTEVTYRWPGGKAPGAIDFSSDRWHLKWETHRGAPQAWKMFSEPSEATAETIPGNPSHQDSAAAENEFAQLEKRGAGQPYLIAIKLHGEPNTLHLRAYLARGTERYSWADLKRLPQLIRDLATQTSTRKHISFSPILLSGGVLPNPAINTVLSQLLTSPNPRSVIGSLDAGTGRLLAKYLKSPGYGLFFDPARNHDAWEQTTPLAAQLATSASELLGLLETRFPMMPESDAAAEALDADLNEIEVCRNQIKDRNFEVADSTATMKTRGSAQKAFADAVKFNYGFRCAVTGIATRAFLIASHIVPWSMDQTIRLDPSNGICLSLLIDRAFETGYLRIEDDLTIRIDWGRVGKDEMLRRWLEPFDGQKLNTPTTEGPKLEYLQRRRAMDFPTE